MKNASFLIVFIASTFMYGCSEAQVTTNNQAPPMKAEIPADKLPKSEEEWKAQLSPEQYTVLRQKGTEAPGTGAYLYTNDKGVYTCGGCGTELFTSDMKFDSHCGWPSFDREIEGGKIKKITDFSHGMTRTEIVCAKCGGHLGHIFDDGPTQTGQRYCVNSLSLGFKKSQ